MGMFGTRRGIRKRPRVAVVRSSGEAMNDCIKRGYHIWPVSGAWGVIIGVTRCADCGVTSTSDNVYGVDREEGHD
jgi:hypothetical protein